MNIIEIFSLFGGLALFLHGMQMMSDGLEDTAGNRMKRILEKLTANRFLGVAVGAGITAAIQSSSATTVMVVGFVNSRMMTLRQAVWVIMGANIGTTITAQLITLDIGMMAPILAFLGVAMNVFIKIPRFNYIGKIMAGFGILFVGMDMMRAAMAPLEQSELFISLMTNFSNPVIGILAGILFTALIQSSSAAVGILQALVGSGLIPFSSAIFVLFGSNIGTCITAVLASIGANRAAKRTTIIHLLFNVIGTGVFTVLCLALPIAQWVGSVTPDNPVAQVANMHTFFNVATTCLLLPFGTCMAKFAEKILPESVKGTASSLTALTEEFRRNISYLGATAVHTDILSQEIRRIVVLAGENAHQAFGMILNGNLAEKARIDEKEDLIDTMNNEISEYISKILVRNNNGANIESIESYFLITGNAERISDHAENIAEYAELIKKKGITFSSVALAEVEEMQSITARAFDKVLNIEADAIKWLSDIAAIEQRIDDMTTEYREKHLRRMCEGLCSEEAFMLYTELLTDFERIGDHMLNIAQAYSKIHLCA